MKTFTLLKPIFFCLSALMLATACSDDKKSTPTPPSALKWRGTEELITKAFYAREDNAVGNNNPKEYFVLETENFWLKIIIPQQYIGLDIDKNKMVWPLFNFFDIRFKHKQQWFSFEMPKGADYPDSAVVGGAVKIVSGSDGYYEIDTQINIKFADGDVSNPRIEILDVYFNGKMTNDETINEWIDPTPDLRRR